MAARDSATANARIGAALLDVLTAAGDAAGRARVLSAISVDEPTLRGSGVWIPERVLHSMFEAVAATERLGRRVGQSLLTTDRVGLLLCYSGVATVEKAYRRASQLLPRVSPEGRYETAAIEGERARIVYHCASAAEANPVYCSMRRGMLEAIPLLYGLLPARVRETECAQEGGKRCVFEVRWSRGSRSGLLGGAALGGVAGLVMPALLMGLPVAASGHAVLALVAGLAAALGATAGRSLDLARQLEAVAGGRRGHLALLDQADRSLAEKLDQIAKLGATLDAARSDEVARMARQSRAPRTASAERAAVPRPVAGGEREEEHSAAYSRKALDLNALARRAVGMVSFGKPDSVTLALRIEGEVPPLFGSSVQIEQLLIQLLGNGINAVAETGRVSLVVRGGPEGVELVVEDDGPGIGDETVDCVFDPFEADRVAGVDCGFGLPVSYRIAKEHGGEMRIEASPQRGTRITVWLPGSVDASR